jgi:proteasome lid subunit RPN8/RPN11
MMVRISRSLHRRILAECEGQSTEICGLLLGRPDEIEEARVAANVAVDPTRHFEVDPVMLIAAHKAARKGGPGLLGHYHSHPLGSAEPSATDAACAAVDGTLWLIVARGEMQLWRAAGEGLHGMFTAQDLAVVD